MADQILPIPGSLDIAPPHLADETFLERLHDSGRDR